MKKVQILLFVLIVGSGAFASSKLVQQNSVGARAFALGNNYVALSNDFSGLFWNPAGMAFAPVREFHGSLEGMQLNGDSRIFGYKTSENIQRLRLSSLGYMSAVPATQGGFTYAMGFLNPIVFDDISSFKTEYIGIDGNRISIDKQWKNSGGLRLWTGGFGLQVAPSVAVGIAASMVSGKEDTKDNYIDILNGDPWSENYKYEERYFGYDLRFGVMYKADIFSAGLRFCTPQIIRRRETVEGNNGIDARLYSSYSGAGGVSVTLPFVTIAAEGRVTLPLDFLFPSEDIPSNSQASRFKKGGGIGFEFPVVAFPMLVRLGYSYDELDFYQYVVRYDKRGSESEFNWYDDDGYGFVDKGMKVDKDRQQFTAGIGFFSSSASFDISYGYQFWGIITNENLKQKYNVHRVSTSLSMRF